MRRGVRAMTDFQGALEKAIYDRLTAEVTLADVFQHVPESTPPPVVIISDVDFENQGDKFGALFLFTVNIVSLVQGPGRKPLAALQAEVFEALNDWTPTATASVQFGNVKVTSGSGQEIQAAQGPIYYGQQSATCFVQAV